MVSFHGKIVPIAGATGVVIATWLVNAIERTATDTAKFVSPVDVAERQRAEKFLKGDPKRPIRSGQEMKPQW